MFGGFRNILLVRVIGLNRLEQRFERAQKLLGKRPLKLLP